jgi:hypothetical protein
MNTSTDTENKIVLSNKAIVKNIIITATDSKYADFLINHWLKSLQDNVNTQNIDILVLDYGMTDIQVQSLKCKGVLIKKCVRDGYVVTIRYRDIANFLSSNSYDQVLLIDSGDLIFQSDIAELFSEHKDSYRAFCERMTLVDMNKVYLEGFFDDKDIKPMREILSNKEPINGGVIIGPADKILSLAKEVWSMVKKKDAYGPDQTAVNYIFYRDGFKSLHDTYNMIITTGGTDFFIKNNTFYFLDGKKISIVHNAGMNNFLRPIKNFGYGPNNNRSKKVAYYVIKHLAKIKMKIKR